MEEASFNKLVELIAPRIEKDPKMSTLRTGKSPITPEIALHCLLRWLSGGSHHDIRMSAGVSVTTFYVYVHKCIYAILNTKELLYKFPETQEECNEASRSFQKLSTHGMIDGCVACLDGFLLQIKTPNTTETANVKSYFSGHYHTYGINVQAACDSRCRFVYVSVNAPGGTNDIRAYDKSTLPKKVNALPLGKYVIADNAYVCSDKLLTPYHGEERRDPANDTFNFFLSQLRIRIEMSFGMLVNKFCIFKRPLAVKLKHAGKNLEDQSMSRD